MFHHMRAIAKSELAYELPKDKREVHRHLRNALQAGATRHRRFADRLRYGLADRAEADYETESTFDRRKANDAVARARAILKPERSTP